MDQASISELEKELLIEMAAIAAGFRRSVPVLAALALALTALLLGVALSVGGR